MVKIRLLLVAIFTMSGVFGHDHERPELDSWFNELKSGRGPCCSYVDGYSLADADWKTTPDGHHYQVYLPTVKDGKDFTWVDVSDDAVVTTPNRDGRTWVWPEYGYIGVRVRCFMPGPGT